MDTKQPITEFAQQWGLPLDEIRQLGQRPKRYYDRFRLCIRTKTRDTSEYGLQYVSGLLRMETGRTMANIDRKTDVSRQNFSTVHFH